MDRGAAEDRRRRGWRLQNNADRRTDSYKGPGLGRCCPKSMKKKIVAMRGAEIAERVMRTKYHPGNNSELQLKLL